MAVNCFHPINYHGNELVLISQNEHLFFVWFQCQVHPIVEERSWSDTPLAILIKRCFRLFQIVVTSTNSISLHQNIGLNILDRDDKLSNFSNPRRFNLYSDIQCLMVCSSDKGLVVQRILLLDIDLGQLKFSLSLRRGYILQLGCELWSHQETWKLLLLHLKLYNQFSLSPRIISPFQSPFKAHIKQSMKIL